MYLLQVLALELGNQLVQALVVCINADGLENSFDIFGGRRGVATEPEKEICCEVFHGDCASSCVGVEVGMSKETCDTFVIDVSNGRVNRFNREMSGD